MIRKVLLVYPEYPDTYWSFKYSLKFIGKKSNFPPLGLLTVAALMPKDYELKLIDMNVEKLTEKDIINSDIVFISAMLIQKESMDKVLKLCKRLGKPVAAGGPYPTSSYQDIEDADYLVLNEAEITLPHFLHDFENNKAQKIYRTVLKPEITETPAPRFDLIKLDRYSSVSLQYSRGCPFNCEFCDIIELFGRVPRTKTPSQFLHEMEILYQSGYRGSVFIVDDNFIGNKFKVKVLLRAIIRWQNERHFPFLFFTEASVDLAQDDELLNLLKNAGFTMVFLGIETPVEASLLLTHKKQNTKSSLLESVHLIQSKGIEVSGGFILGFDNDPDNIADLQIDFIQKSGICTAMVGLLTALPNTQLYQRLEKEGRLLKLSSGNNTLDLDLNFIPVMPKEKLIAAYQKVIQTVYNPKQYFQRCWTFIRNIPHSTRTVLGTSTRANTISYALALLRSLRKQIFSSYGIHYIRFLLKTIIHKPSLFPKAIQMAIYGYHFFKMTDNEITQKSKLLERFGHLLDNRLNYLRQRFESIPAERIRKAFSDIIRLRDKILPELAVKYNVISHLSNQKIENALRFLDSAVQKRLRVLDDFLWSNLKKPILKDITRILLKAEMTRKNRMQLFNYQGNEESSATLKNGRNLIVHLQQALDREFLGLSHILGKRSGFIVN